MENGKNYRITFNENISAKCYTSECMDTCSDVLFNKGQSLEATFIRHNESEYMFYCKSYGWFKIQDPSFDSYKIYECVLLKLDVMKTVLTKGTKKDKISLFVKSSNDDLVFDATVSQGRGEKLLNSLGIFDFETTILAKNKSKIKRGCE